MVRPTSETIIGRMYAQWVHSWRDLPIFDKSMGKRGPLGVELASFCGRWNFVARRPYRSRIVRGSRRGNLRMLEVYRSFAEDFLAIPVLSGPKTESEKFAGAVTTYCIEGLMQDGRALQMGTSHFLGQNFSKAFEIRFEGRDQVLQHAWTTSWGVSTRLIGALIMSHSDDDGLVLPSRVSPYVAAIVPIFRKEEEKKPRP